jgi:hypothetical protein
MYRTTLKSLSPDNYPYIQKVTHTFEYTDNYPSYAAVLPF